MHVHPYGGPACRLAGAWGSPLRSSPSADSWNGGSLVSTCGPNWYPCTEMAA